MSKDGSIKHPVPENGAERFMVMVWMLAEMSGIEEIPDIYHHVELLGESVARHVFEKTHKVSPQKRVHDDRKRFIAIFKTRYEQLLDLEYNRAITPLEAKLINQLNKSLVAECFTIDDYLAWVFDDFLQENPKFRPPTIKSICAQFFVHKFLVDNQELKDARKRQELDKKSGFDLITRARHLLRGGLSKEDDQKIKDSLKDYGERRIMLSELRQTVEEIEKKTGKKTEN